MKCARCGRNVPDDAPRCPYCEQGGAPLAEEQPQPQVLRCPVCGSTHISAVRKNYSPGCGCLGLLLLGWWGLLLGLLGAGQVEMVCADCGARWPAGKIHQAHRGCLIFHILLAVAGTCAALLLLFVLTLFLTNFYLK